MKIQKLLCLSFISLLALTSCNDAQTNIEKEKDVLTIYNCEEYICEDLITGFEEKYNVTVNYYTFDTNETLYNQLTLQPEGTYDLICPSEYMIQRLVSKDLIIELDQSKLETYNAYVSKKILSKISSMPTSKNDENGNPLYLNSFTAGYMWGTMGLIYNSEIEGIEEDIKSWDILWNENYKGLASIKNSMRDTYVVGIMRAYKDELNEFKEKYEKGEITAKEYNDKVQEIFNRHDDEDIQKVKAELISLKQNSYGFETDSGKTDITGDKIDINLAWSGDAVYSIETAYEQENQKLLKYSVPEEGSNIWYDGWVMPKGANEDLAYKFINYISDPENAAINMNEIGYTSFITSNEVFDNVVSWYGASDYHKDTNYYAENLDEEIDASVVRYNDRFYMCIKDATGILPTNEEYFEELSSEDSPLDEGYDLSYYFEGIENIPSDKSLKIYPYEECLNRLETQYPSEEIVNRCAFMNDFGEEDNKKLIIMWGQVKASTNMVPYYIILLVILLVVPTYMLIKLIVDKTNEYYANKRLENKNNK